MWGSHKELRLPCFIFRLCICEGIGSSLLKEQSSTSSLKLSLKQFKHRHRHQQSHKHAHPFSNKTNPIPQTPLPSHSNKPSHSQSILRPSNTPPTKNKPCPPIPAAKASWVLRVTAPLLTADASVLLVYSIAPPNHLDQLPPPSHPFTLFSFLPLPPFNPSPPLSPSLPLPSIYA